MEKRELIYEGKAKKLYTTDDPDLLIQYFKDDATAHTRLFRHVSASHRSRIPAPTASTSEERRAAQAGRPRWTPAHEKNRPSTCA